MPFRLSAIREFIEGQFLLNHVTQHRRESDSVVFSTKWSNDLRETPEEEVSENGSRDFKTLTDLLGHHVFRRQHLYCTME